MSEKLQNIVFNRETFRTVFNASDSMLDDLHLYAQLLLKWQKYMNLIGKSSVHDIWGRHFADSIQLFNLLNLKAKTLIDLGSGAGFPGLILALKFLDSGGPQVHLIESNQRKAGFLMEANRILKTRVIVHAKRIENINDLKGDIIIARGLAPLDRLLNFAKMLIKHDSECFFLKGQNVSQELTEAKKKWKMNVIEINSLTRKGAKILKITKISSIAKI